MVWGPIRLTTTHLRLAQNILTSPVAHPASYTVGTVSPFPRLNWQRRETAHSLQSNADIVNGWSNIPTLHISLLYVERYNILFCFCLCNTILSNK